MLNFLIWLAVLFGVAVAGVAAFLIWMVFYIWIEDLIEGSRYDKQRVKEEGERLVKVKRRV